MNRGCARLCAAAMALLAPVDGAVSEQDHSEFELGALALGPTVERIDRGYRIEQSAGLRLGAGGAQFSYESPNGDVHLKRIAP